MARLGINDLPKPQKGYRPSRGQAGFESCKNTRKEDALRAKRLRSKEVLASPRVSKKTAKRLARRLERAASGRSVPATLASSTYLRDFRDRLGGALWQLVATALLPAATFTLLSRTWIFTPDQLQNVDARKLIAGVRQDLIRAGAAKAKGALILFLHGEFEPESGYFLLHFHGLALADMIDVVDRLRKRRKYRPVARGKDGRPAIKTPVRISREPLTNLPGPLTYLLKRYWPAKRIGAVDGSDKDKRNRRHGRIPEPYHSEALLWLDRWTLSDISMMMGMYVSASGFCLSPRSAKSRRARWT
jgi:hypothetical protein